MDTGGRITIETPMRFRDALPQAVDVAIIGGGVIGVFAALYLARAGKSVFLAEKGRVAGEQSSRNWGWIRQQGRDAAELPIAMQAVRLWQEVDAELNGACGVAVGGCYYLGSSAAEVEKHHRWLKLAAAHGLDTRALTRAEIAEAFGGQADGRWLGGILTPSDARGEPWQAVPAVAGLARAGGAAIREGCAVRALDIAAGRVRGIVTEDGPVRAEQVILAGGAWSSLLARRHGVVIPQLTVRDTVAQTAPLPGFFGGTAADEALALRRRADGGFTLSLSGVETHFVGPDSFRHFRAFLPLARQSWRATGLRPMPRKGFPDGWTTPRGWAEDEPSPFEATRVLEPVPGRGEAAAMQARFAERFPGIGRPELRQVWAGMIDTMPDVVPVVDRVPGLDGLILATGMSGHGFGIGPGFGLILSRMVQGAAPGFDMDRFRFGRFSDGSAIRVGDAL
ncbi:MAG: FAD-binding oxidoreductase [Paracoccaceae bacterium]